MPTTIKEARWVSHKDIKQGLASSDEHDVPGRG
jgi:hypothetical protein